MKALSPDSFLARVLGRLTAAIIRRPRWFFWPQVVLFFLSIAVTVKYLQFDTNRDNLVGGNQRSQDFHKIRPSFSLVTTDLRCS